MTNWHTGGSKDTAAQIRREVRAAIKDRTLPETSKASVRTIDAGSTVVVNLTTEHPGKYFDRDAQRLTEEGRDVATVLSWFVKPHMLKVDGQLSFLHVKLDGRDFNPWQVA